MAMICGAALLFAACSGAVHRAAPSTDIDEMGFRDDVRVLASDDFDGRRPGTPGEEKTIGFLTSQFRKLGLKPGNGESYLQQVPLAEITGSDATLSIAGRGGAMSLEYGKDMVIWSKREVPEASLRHSDLVFVGYGILAPEYGWNDYSQVDVHGKTVVIMVGDPGQGTQDPRVFRGSAGTEYGRWAYKVEEAARQGAAGAILIHDAAAAGYAWNIVVNDRTGPQLEIVASDGAGRTAIEGSVSLATARAMFKLAGLDFESLTQSAGRPGFKPTAMGLQADATLHNSIRHISSPNVVAVLPGTDRKREYVLYTAHWDHLGRQAGQPGGAAYTAGAVFNGARDDASGVAGLLMLAQSFSRTRPAASRSIAFIAFTAGESGLLGSAFYVSHPLYPSSETVGVLNLDILHIGGPTRDVMVFGNGNSELEDYLKDAALQQGREVHPDPYPQWGFYYRSDQYNFAKSGVPALYARAGLDDAARGPAWGRQQLDDYLVHRYHQTSDKYSDEWDVRGTIEDLRLYYDVGNRLAHSRRFPRFYPTSEFGVNH